MYNRTKVWVYVFEQMIRKYSVKSASRRWPIHVFYNLLDTAILNSWIVYKDVTRLNISRREYMFDLMESMLLKQKLKRIAETPSSSGKAGEKCQRLTSKGGTCNRSKTLDRCDGYNLALCSRCTKLFCNTCLNLYLIVYVNIEI